jgi:hypothetical protein
MPSRPEVKTHPGHAWAFASVIRACLQMRAGEAAGWRQSLTTRLLLAGAVAGSLGLTPPAEAIPNQPGPSYGWVASCTNLPLYAPWPNCPPSHPRLKLTPILVDWGGPATEIIDSIHLKFTYDRSIMSFNAAETTLLCDLRPAGTPPLCPPLQPGQGTTPLGIMAEDYIVNQSGLTITEDATGLPAVTLTYNAPTPLSLTGERNFLALAFDLLVPLDPGAAVTYSPTVLADASLVTDDFYCTNPSGASVNCSSSHPSLSFKLNPVPGPLAVGGLPVMAEASRRIRRRIRQAAG